MEPTKQQIEAAAIFLTERMGYMTTRVLTFGALCRLVAEYGEAQYRDGFAVGRVWAPMERIFGPEPDAPKPRSLEDYGKGPYGMFRVRSLADPNSANPDAEWLEFIKSVNKLEEK